MRADDPSIKRVTPPTLNWAEKTYIPQILGGLLVTGRHIVSAALGKGAITLQYPGGAARPFRQLSGRAPAQQG